MSVLGIALALAYLLFSGNLCTRYDQSKTLAKTMISGQWVLQSKTPKNSRLTGKSICYLFTDASANAGQTAASSAQLFVYESNPNSKFYQPLKVRDRVQFTFSEDNHNPAIYPDASAYLIPKQTP